jgi:uncharacterized membrane protein YgcG
MKNLFKSILFALVLVIPSFVSAQTNEKITSYHSDIEVFEDASMIVTEEIQVTSTGDQIQRGIYRDFPTAYRDNNGLRHNITFDILEILRNGISEPYHTQRAGNGIRIYIGEENVFLTPGEYTYTIKYKTSRQLGFFENHDELYWNVTGNGWVFPINSASATVKLPSGIPENLITSTVFTGPQGSTNQNALSEILARGVVIFATSQELNPYEGLTIVVSWPKGFVTPPTALENFWAKVQANLGPIMGLGSFLLVLAYYLYTWHKRGRDPLKGLIIAQYEPPQNLSPAMMRYIQRMGEDNKAFAASIINLGVKEVLTMKEDKGLFKTTSYTLAQKNNPPTGQLSTEESLLKSNLFSTRKEFIFTGKYNSETKGLYESFVNSLKSQADKKYFATNYLLSGIGGFLSLAMFILTIVTVALTGTISGTGLEATFWILLFMATITMNIIFHFLLRAYTVEGRKLMDEIEGFKLFLSVTEKDKLNFHNPPELTPKLFEKMLPYALALDVENKWANQFAQVFKRLDEQGTSYSPVWYAGSIAHFNANTFASNMNSSFTGAVAASASPPGSSSGSGGSSGGGGGGGGGGGW